MFYQCVSQWPADGPPDRKFLKLAERYPTLQRHQNEHKQTKAEWQKRNSALFLDGRALRGHELCCSNFASPDRRLIRRIGQWHSSSLVNLRQFGWRIVDQIFINIRRFVSSQIVKHRHAPAESR